MIGQNNRLDADQKLYYKKLYLTWIRYLDFEGFETPPAGISKADGLYYSGKLHQQYLALKGDPVKVKRDARTIESNIIACRVQFNGFKGKGIKGGFFNKLKWLRDVPVANVINNPSKCSDILFYFAHAK